MKTANVISLIMVILGAICLFAGSAEAIIVDLDGYDVGAVVAGEQPDGVMSAESVFEDFTIAVDNFGSGPNSLVVCEAAVFMAHGDKSLLAEAKGPDGGNDHIMIIAGNVLDRRPVDGLVDDPAPQAEGGTVAVHFNAPVNLAYVLLDVTEHEGFSYKLIVDGVPTVSVSDGAQWESGGIFIDLDGYQSVNTMSLELGGGVGIARIAYFPESVAAETAAWGAVKALYR